MKLKTYLTLTGLNQSQFAERIGVSQVAVHRYISGGRRPEWPVLDRIAKVTDGAVTPNDFFEAASLQ